MLNTARTSVICRLKKYGGILGERAYTRQSLETAASNLSGRHSEEWRSGEGRACGQPTPATHPHLVKPGQLTPGIQLSEFKQRRSKLMESIVGHARVANLGKSHILIVPSASKVYMSGKIPYVFRQNTDFLYFTGCQEPDSILVITVKDEEFVSTLFVSEQDKHSELWDGPKTGVELAPSMFGVDSALPLADFEQVFVSFLNANKSSTIWYDGVNVAQPTLHRKLREMVKVAGGQVVASPTSVMQKIRVIKSQAEIELMKASCEIVSAAIAKTIEISKPKMSEHQLFATVDYECRMNGAEFLAYPPVVAAGNNANVIHYIANNQIIREGDIVLMDAGCEYHAYSSDVTRTWPISGTFSQPQKILYEIVLDVQTILIDKIKELPTLEQLYDEMGALLGKRLQEAALIPKHLSKSELLAAVYAYCPHHVSHYLGMDVHDTGNISRNAKLQPGAIITVEPGLYVSRSNQFAPREFYGQAVRIEDDVLVTENGPTILTKPCPKQVAEIEALASRNLQ